MRNKTHMIGTRVVDQFHYKAKGLYGPILIHQRKSTRVGPKYQ